jgi:protein-S-isoprenylcysteine O-methyltransferase Ste14
MGLLTKKKMELIPDLQLGIWNAWILMSVFILQMLVIMFPGKRPRRSSHVPSSTKHNRLERNIAAIANIVWLSALVYSVFLPLKSGTIWFYAGISVFVTGLAVLILSTINFMRTPTGNPITKGAYRVSRHPMYLATFLICLGAGFASGSWIFIFLTVVMILCFHIEALVEERYCIDKYGDAYRKYMDNTPRWIVF